jgi:hypothetical protein
MRVKVKGISSEMRSRSSSRVEENPLPPTDYSRLVGHPEVIQRDLFHYHAKTLALAF